MLERAASVRQNVLHSGCWRRGGGNHGASSGKLDVFGGILGLGKVVVLEMVWRRRGASGR